MEVNAAPNSKPYTALLRDLVESARHLVLAEIDLFKAESVDATKRIWGQATTLLTGLWLIGFAGFALLSSLILVLGDLWDGRYWLSALAVGAVVGVAGAFMVYRAIQVLKNEPGLTETRNINRRMVPFEIS